MQSGRRVLARRLEVLLRGIDADDVADERGERVRERARAASDVERPLVAGERGEQPPKAGLELGRGARPGARGDSRSGQTSRTTLVERPGTTLIAAGELVRDRIGHTGVLLERDAVSHDRHGRARLDRRRKRDREGVHRDRADDRRADAFDQQLRARQVPPEPVAVPHGHEPDPRRLGRDESPAVPRRLARLEPPHLRHLRLPAQRRPQVEARGAVAERVDPVQRDPAARRVETCLGEHECSGAVGDVPHEDSGIRLGCPEKPLELLLREPTVGVRGREMGHQADDGRPRDGELGEAPPAHPRVELEVDAHPFRQPSVGHRQLERRVACDRDVLRPGRPEHEDPQLGNAERSGSASPTVATQSAVAPPSSGGSRDVERSVPVAVSLDDGPELGVLEDARQDAGVVPDRLEVDGDARAHVRHSPLRRREPGGRAPRRRRRRQTRPGAATERAASPCATARGRRRRPSRRAPLRGRRRRRRSARRPCPRSRARAARCRRRSTRPPGCVDDRVRRPSAGQTAPKRSAQRRAASSRCAPTQSESASSSRASSPACGVSTGGAVARDGLEPVEGVRVDDAGSCERSSSDADERSVPSSERPSPGPIASADARSRSRREVVERRHVYANPRFTGSSARASATASDDSGTASVT